jgi:streptogramin lyase
VDGAGNVFVADRGNDTIRKITPAGVVTTLAGTVGSSGSADGTGAAASFSLNLDDWNLFSGVAVDGADNVFVADSSNHTIRMVTSTGVVTTLAGSARLFGSVDGTGATARFAFPYGVAVDGAGNVFVADSGNDTIRKITPAGVVTTLAGTGRSSGSADGTGAVAKFYNPCGVAVDRVGNVLIADLSNSTIRKITPIGVVTTLARLEDSPEGVAVDGAGNVFVAGNDTIRKVTPAGVVTTLAGTAGSSGSADGTGSAASFNGASGVAVDGAGNVFVADSGNNTIRKVTPAGVVTTLAGTAGSSGSADGTGAVARFYWPSGVAVDEAGNVFVADTKNNAIRKVTPAGVVTTFARTADYSYPSRVAVDGEGNVFVADSGNNTIQRITPSGVVTTIVGVAAPASAGNFPGPLPASIVSPEGVAFDSSTGKLYITLPDAVMAAVLP